MPTYTVSSPAAWLSVAQKALIAQEITKVHKDATCAQSFFAQVVFVDVVPGNWYLGGKLVQDGDHQIFIHGQVRAGRSKEVKHRLLTQLMKSVGEIADCPSNRVWAYIVELPPSLMGEYGHVLPEPGDELAWLDSLPAEDRALMQSIGL